MIPSQLTDAQLATQITLADGRKRDLLVREQERRTRSRKAALRAKAPSKDALPAADITAATRAIYAVEHTTPTTTTSQRYAARWTEN
jgi:hypothetical protein